MCYLFIGFPTGTQENNVFQGSKSFPQQHKNVKIDLDIFMLLGKFRFRQQYAVGEISFSATKKVAIKLLQNYYQIFSHFPFNKYFYYY